MIGVAWIRFSPLDQFTATRKLGCSKVRAVSTEASGVRGGLGRTGTLLVEGESLPSVAWLSRHHPN